VGVTYTTCRRRSARRRIATTVVNGQTVLVEPRTRRIVQVIN